MSYALLDTNLFPWQIQMRTHALEHIIYSHTSCTSSVHHVQMYIMHELPQRYCGYNLEVPLFLWLHIYYAHLTSVRFAHCVCHESLIRVCYTKGIQDDKSKFPENLLIKIIQPIIKTYKKHTIIL